MMVELGEGHLALHFFHSACVYKIKCQLSYEKCELMESDMLTSQVIWVSVWGAVKVVCCGKTSWVGE